MKRFLWALLAIPFLAHSQPLERLRVLDPAQAANSKSTPIPMGINIGNVADSVSDKLFVAT